MTLSMPRQIASIPLLRQLLDVVLRHRDVTARCRGELAVLISEASSNAVRHGHGDRPIEASIDVDDQRCVLEIGNCDGHLDLSRLQAGMPTPDQESGRGLPLIGMLAYTVHVLHNRPAWVIVRITKRLEYEPLGAGDP
jgi:anti-sigma regulatory factor (Ser/Thr protein kinase)